MNQILQLMDFCLVKGGRKILDIPSFTVEEGQVTAIMGPNGAGKTSLLNVMAVLQVPTAGTVFFRGQDISKINQVKLRRRFAFVFQESLFLDTTVYKNVEAGLKFRGMPGRENRQRVEFWLERLGVKQLARRSVKYLSGGEAQRVSLARTFVLKPEVLFLDEPFSNLDRETRDDLLELLGTLLKETGATAVFVTHRRSEVLALADMVCCMESGKIISHETIEEFIKSGK